MHKQTCRVCGKSWEPKDLEEFFEHVRTCDAVRQPDKPKPKKNKYNAIRTEYNGVLFDSKLEADYAKHLDGLRAGDSDFFYLRQVPFDLPGKIKYRCDFMTGMWCDGKCILTFIDTSGKMTRTKINKIKQVEALYPVKIIIVKRGDF